MPERAVGVVCEECILSKHSFVVLGIGDGGPCPEHRAAVAPTDHDLSDTAATPESAPVGPGRPSQAKENG